MLCYTRILDLLDIYHRIHIEGTCPYSAHCGRLGQKPPPPGHKSDLEQIQGLFAGWESFNMFVENLVYPEY